MKWLQIVSHRTGSLAEAAQLRQAGKQLSSGAAELCTAVHWEKLLGYGLNWGIDWKWKEIPRLIPRKIYAKTYVSLMIDQAIALQDRLKIDL